MESVRQPVDLRGGPKIRRLGRWNDAPHDIQNGHGEFDKLVPDKQSAEVGGIQNAVTNLGASIGTALAGSILIAALTASFLSSVEQNEAIPSDVKRQATIELQSGVPFLSDAQLKDALDDAGTSKEVTQAALDANEEARLDGLRATLAILALASLLAMFFTQRIPTTQPGSAEP